MNKILEKIDQAMPPGGVLDVTLENIQNIASALVLARSFIQTQDFQIRSLQAQLDFRAQYYQRVKEFND